MVFIKDNIVLFVAFVLSEPGELAVVPSDPCSSLVVSVAKISEYFMRQLYDSMDLRI